MSGLRKHFEGGGGSDLRPAATPRDRKGGGLPPRTDQGSRKPQQGRIPLRGRHGWTCAPRKLNTREGPTSRCTRHVVRNRQPEERGKDARNHSSVEAPTPRRTGRVNLTSELPDGTPLRSHAPRFSLPPTRVALSTAREAAKDGRQDKGEKEARDAGHR